LTLFLSFKKEGSMNIRFATAAAATALLLGADARAEGVISVNFVRTADEAFAGGESVGPLATDSARWNSVLDRDSGTLASGSMNNLIDDDGNVTAAGISWQASTVWSTSEVYTNDQQRLSRGYLDDGNIGDGLGLRVTISGIPYEKYRVYGLLGSDRSNAGAAYTTRDFLLNGTVWVFGGLRLPDCGPHPAARTRVSRRNAPDASIACGLPATRLRVRCIFVAVNANTMK
jgi:hypothetical protein